MNGGAASPAKPAGPRAWLLLAMGAAAEVAWLTALAWLAWRT
jgi:hypothetical protein